MGHFSALYLRFGTSFFQALQRYSCQRPRVPQIPLSLQYIALVIPNSCAARTFFSCVDESFSAVSVEQFRLRSLPTIGFDRVAMAAKDDPAENRSEFDALIAASSRDLTLGLFDAALGSADLASSIASSAEERASAAVMRIQCLHEVHSDREALQLADSATSNVSHTKLTHDLALTSASLALHDNETGLAERVLTSWLGARLSDSSYPVDSVKDFQLVRMLVLRVMKPLHGGERGAELLERARSVLSEMEYSQLRGELVEGDGAITEINSPERRPADPQTVRDVIVAQRRNIEQTISRLGERVRCWLQRSDGVDRRAALGVAIGAVAIWLFSRPRGRNPSLLRVLRASLLEILNIAFGTSFGRRTITNA